MGLNNDGADRVAARLARVRRIPGRPLGINIVKTHDPSIVGEAAVDDFRASFRMMAPFADYVTLNVSCPNTVEGRTFEDPEVLDVLLTALSDERESLTKGVRVLVKLSPPMNARVVFDSLIEEIVAVSSDHGIDGFVATNTTPDRTDLTTPAEQLQAIGAGGLSGPPLAKRSTALVSYLFRKTEGKVPIIGVGGVDSADAAYEKILAGASLVQLYTGMVYDGPGLVRSIKEGLVGHLKEDGYASISQAVGKAHVEA
jgi:dihydroorotate dehydrogenase